MRVARLPVLFGFALALPAAVGAAAAADAGNGGAIAARWCAGCHASAPGRPRSDADPPTFAMIARHPDLDAARLAAFLMTPHPRMPDMSLTRREIEDLAAHIKAQAR
jgi:mono/diheme cytochrome c family protein